MASSGRLSNGAAMVAQGKLRATSSEDGKEDDDDDCRSPLLEDFEMIKTIDEPARRESTKGSRKSPPASTLVASCRLQKLPTSMA
ncbi:hypothetical protein HPB47_028269 [Ixodes persulcatus]|uniref:Uncharacterized protein n=1 Tax=Ixodes persulcatus TaxID=34615 RepID=A0AC60PTQ4_IXOPE|nr:hypothetical protein HPB47_028269 [Ixodes persulcatus]